MGCAEVFTDILPTSTVGQMVELAVARLSAPASRLHASLLTRPSVPAVEVLHQLSSGHIVKNDHGIRKMNASPLNMFSNITIGDISGFSALHTVSNDPDLCRNALSMRYTSTKSHGDWITIFIGACLCYRLSSTLL